MRSDARFCSTRCRVASHRAGRSLPLDLTDRRAWSRRDGKRPIRVNGLPASSTNPATWCTYAEAVASTAGDGLGIMLGGGLGCYDLDHCLSGDVVAPWAREALEGIPERVVWVERSMSGTGLHVFVEAPEVRGYRRRGVERYTRDRFIAVTGVRFVL